LGWWERLAGQRLAFGTPYAISVVGDAAIGTAVGLRWNDQREIHASRCAVVRWLAPNVYRSGIGGGGVKLEAFTHKVPEFAAATQPVLWGSVVAER
jgi:hypothetical protein